MSMPSLLGFNGTADYRQTVTTLPQKPVCLPYELRTEMTWMDFCHPVNPMGTPKPFIQAMHSALVEGELAYVPDRDGHVLRDELARYLGIDRSCILVGTSVTKMIRATAQAYACGVVGIMMPAPADYALAITNAGHDYIEIENPNSFATLDAYTARSMYGDFDGMVLANPSYPTSRLLQSDTLVHYLETCGWVIVDESYIELAFGAESLLPLIERYSNLIVVRSPSVTFGMPGVPLSYIAANPATIKQIRQFYDGADATMVAEVLAKSIVRHGDFLERTHEFLDTEIPWMQCMLSLIPGISIHPAEGNFVLCEFTPGEEMRLSVTCAEELIVKLQLAGFLVNRLAGSPGLPSDEFFCVCVRTREENQKLLDAMRGIINGDK